MTDTSHRFGRTKPFPFAPKISVTFEKVINIDSEIQNLISPEQFNELLQQNQEELTFLQKKQLSAFKSAQNLRGLSKSIGVNEILDQSRLTEIEFSENYKYNQEQLFNDQLFRNYLKDQLSVNNVYALEEAEDSYTSSEDMLDEFINRVEEVGFDSPAEQTTIAHDVNMYKGEANVFKKQEYESYEFFNNSIHTKQLINGSVSPKRVLEELEPGFWSQVRNDYKDIQQFELRMSPEELRKLNVDFIDRENLDLNWENAPDAYSDNKSNSLEINANSVDILKAGFWKRFTPQQTFSFIQNYWENAQRSMDFMREWLGFSKNQAHSSHVNNAELASDIVQENIEKTRLTLENIDRKWDLDSSHLKSVEVLHMSIAPQLLPEAVEKLDIRNNTTFRPGTQSMVKFEEKLLTDYMQHLRETFLIPNFTAQQQFDSERLTNQSLHNQNLILNLLKQNGVLTSNNTIVDSIDVNDESFSLDYLEGFGDTTLIRNELRRISISSFNPINPLLNNTEGFPIENVRFKGDDDQFRSFNDIFDLITSQRTSLEDINLAYNHFMEIHAALTGLSIDSNQSNGDIVFSEEENGVRVKLSDQASWSEYTSEDERGEYQNRDNQSLYINFESETQARQFKTKVRQVIALLEPILGVLPNQNVPLQLLVDNSGNTSDAIFMKEGQSGYKMAVDYNFSSRFLNSSDFSTIKDHMLYKVSAKVMTDMFSKTIVNNIIKIKWERDVKEYREEQKRFKEEEYQEKIRDKKS